MTAPSKDILAGAIGVVIAAFGAGVSLVSAAYNPNAPFPDLVAAAFLALLAAVYWYGIYPELD